MSDAFHAARQDRPIGTSRDDALDRGPFVESLIRALVVDELDSAGKLTGRRASGYVVGLTGRWGLGKSSVLSLLAEKLGTMDRTVVAQFSPWLFSGRDELLTGFFSSLRTAMGESNTEIAQQLTKQIDRYWGAINLAGHGVAAVVDLHGGSGAASTGWRTWGPRLKKLVEGQEVRSPEKERLALEGKLASLKCAVVVLIDELDRVEDEEVRAVAQLVKAVGDIKGVSYLVSYDPERVVQALGRGHGRARQSSGEAYLEKIIQHPIPLRPLFEEDAIKLLQAALSHHSIELADPTNDTQRAIFREIIREIKTPREVKRLIGAYSILERAVQNEICAYDVLAYCWLLTKTPSVRDELAANLDRIVSDPEESEALERAARRVNGEPIEVASVLGNAATSQSRLIRHLFPVFGRSVTGPDGDRLFRRRNLVRMLFLGDPPGIIPNREVEALWSLPQPELQAKLETLMDDGRLASVIDRIDDLLPSLAASGDEKFWVSLAAVLHRSSDWLRGPENARAVADDAATSLYRLVLRDPAQSERFSRCLNALVEAGDLILAPWLIRKNLFAHGLTRHSKEGRGGEVLSREATITLLEQEVPRYRTAVVDGTALRRLPNVEAIYVLVNSENWTPELRSILTAQLSGLQEISTLAGLLLPPGHSTDAKHLNELFDVEVIRHRLEEFRANGEWPSELWLAESTTRLLLVLNGRDPSLDAFEQL
ncbi:KAP family NTPase [Tsuneonella sp. HG249]